MAKIYNSDVTKGLANNAGIQQSREKTPDELAEKIVPVMETNPQLLRNAEILADVDVTATAGAALDLISANPKRDVYITGASMTIVKSALCDVANGLKSIYITQNGKNDLNIIAGYVTTTTAETIQRDVHFTRPIKIDRNTPVRTNSFSFAAGTAFRNWVVYGYYVDNPDA